jgi:hypothetical protein
MFKNIKDLPFKARLFAEHCLENFSLNEVVDMIYSDEKDCVRSQFDLSEEQWQDAVYVVIKEMGRGTNRNK